MLYYAPAAIVVCGDPSLEKHPGFWVQYCSATTVISLGHPADKKETKNVFDRLGLN